jgi:hypothetical protein
VTGAPYPKLRNDLPRSCIPDEKQHLDTALHVRTVFGHLAGRQRDRNVAEHADLGSQHGLRERAQFGPFQGLHPFDEHFNRLAFGRAGGWIERRLGEEVRRKPSPISRCSGRPTETRELPGNDSFNGLNIVCVRIGRHGVPPPFTGEDQYAPSAVAVMPVFVSG